MLKNSLLEILKTFSREDLKKFHDFVSSPYFNKKTPVIKLWNSVKQFYPAFDNKNLDRQIVWGNIYPGKDYNYGVMKNLIFDLSRLAERFLQEEMFAENKFERDLQLFHNLSDRDLGKLAMAEYRSLDSLMLSSKGGGERYSKLIDLRWGMEMTSGNLTNITASNVYELSEYTIYNFFISIFKIYNNIAAQKFLNREQRTFNLLEQFLRNTDIASIFESIKKNSAGDHKIINIYYDMYKALSQIEVAESYYNFRDNLLENDHLLDDEERQDLFSCLRTSLSYNKAVKNKPSEFNELMKLQHAKNLLLDNTGMISIRKYSLGIRHAALVKDFDFLNEFINSYLKCTRPSARENMTLYGNAYFQYAKGEFGKALEIISKINFDILSFKFEIKNLQIMLFYELDDIESLMFALDSYKHFASNNPNIDKSTSENIYRFIGYIHALCKIKERPDKIRIRFLKEQILNDNLNTKYWLLEKAEELGKKLGIKN